MLTSFCGCNLPLPPVTFRTPPYSVERNSKVPIRPADEPAFSCVPDCVPLRRAPQDVSKPRFPWKPSWKPCPPAVADSATIHATGLSDADLYAGKFVQKFALRLTQIRCGIRLSANSRVRECASKLRSYRLCGQDDQNARNDKGRRSALSQSGRLVIAILPHWLPRRRSGGSLGGTSCEARTQYSTR